MVPSNFLRDHPPSGFAVTSERRRWRLALGAALVVHASLFASFFRRVDGNVSTRVPAPAPSADVEIELNAEPEPARRSPSTDVRQYVQTPRISNPARSTRAASPARDDDRPELAAVERAEASGTASTELRGEPAPAPPALSLDALGLGATNPFLHARGERNHASAREVSRRVDRVLADGIAKADQRRGLGPEGPLLATLEREARDSFTPPNSTALFRLSTDGSGTLVGVQVIDANSDRGQWQKLGDRVLSRLGKKRLRGAHGANGLSFEIRLVSRVALPSGRDPGLEIDLFDIPVKKGAGKQSTRVRILDALPTYSLQDYELPDGRIIQVPVLSQSVLGVDGDPVDIGAPAARMVHARLERLWAN